MNLWEMLLQWIYPPHCIFCQKLLKIGKETMLCMDGENTFRYNVGPVCQKCGCPMYISQKY